MSKKNITTTSVSAGITHDHYEFEFDKVLSNPTTYKIFAKHVASELNTENLEFLTSVTEFEKLTDAEKLVHEAKQIRDSFIQDKSAKQVNLAGDIVARINHCFTNDNIHATMFLQAKNSVLMTLKYYSFVRFKRSAAWIKYVKTCSDEFLRTLGKHKSELSFLHVGLSEFARLGITDFDFEFANLLMQDYYHWRIIYHKKDLMVCRSSKNFLTEEATQEIGLMDAAKVTIKLNIDAKKATRIMCANKHLPFQKYDVLEYMQGGTAQSKHSAIVSNSILPLGLFSKREYVSVTACVYDPARKCYMGFVRSVFHPKVTAIAKNCVRAHVIGLYLIEELSDHECRFATVSLANNGAWLQPNAKLDFLSDIANIEIGKLFKKHFAAHVNKEVDEEGDKYRLFEAFSENCTKYVYTPKQ